MRLVLTGRAIRASRQTLNHPCRRYFLKSTEAVVVKSSQASLRSVGKEFPTIRRLRSGPKIDNLERIDLYPTLQEEEKAQDGSKTISHEGEEISKTTARHESADAPRSFLGYELDSTSNLSPSILKLLHRNLYAQPNHPLCITRKLIESVFQKPTYKHYVASHPVVSTAMNFDALGFPAHHPGRSPTDTYYVNKDHVLRTHTSAHQEHAFRNIAGPDGARGYTIAADVFRRDSIDRSHFPAFHQMEGARLWRRHAKRDVHNTRVSTHQATEVRLEELRSDLKALSRTPIEVEDPNPAFRAVQNPMQRDHEPEEVQLMVSHLKCSLLALIWKVFEAAGHIKPGRGSPSQGSGQGQGQDQLKVRWVESYFPFTSPSWELEVFWQGEWFELLGCGIVQQKLLRQADMGNHIGWAWGLGLERLAMLLFGIPDIRLLWSEDSRFLDQFREGQVTRFEPFSKYPQCYKDVAFWIDDDQVKNDHPTLPDSSSSISNNNSLAASAGGHPSSSSSSSSSSSPTLPPPTFHENDLMQLVRDIAGSLVEDVRLVDRFVHPATHRTSLCYRVVYRSLERTLTNDEVNDLHRELCRRLQEGGGGSVGGGVELRV